MDEHLGYDKHSSQGDLSGNRNGYKKNDIDAYGQERNQGTP